MQPRAWNFLSVRNHSSHAAHTPTPPSPQLPPPNLLKPVNFIIRELAWGSMWTSTPQLVFREHMTQLCFHAFHNNTLLRHADLGPNPECCDSLGWYFRLSQIGRASFSQTLECDLTDVFCFLLSRGRRRRSLCDPDEEPNSMLECAILSEYFQRLWDHLCIPMYINALIKRYLLISHCQSSSLQTPRSSSAHQNFLLLHPSSASHIFTSALAEL